MTNIQYQCKVKRKFWRFCTINDTTTRFYYNNGLYEHNGEYATPSILIIDRKPVPVTGFLESHPPNLCNEGSWFTAWLVAIVRTITLQGQVRIAKHIACQIG
ncbi:MAG: hypothetical protein ACRCXZ_06295 [Patescibacteria group bacterium]